MDSNPVCHPFPAKKIKGSFLHYVQLLMISQASQWTRTHLPPVSSQKNKMLVFGLHSTSDDRLGWLMDSNPILPPLSSQINKMLIFGLHSTSDDRSGWSMDSNPVCHPSPAKKLKCSFWIMFNFWWSAGLVDGLESRPPPLSSQKNKMVVFGSCSTSDDWLGWSMDLNPICHPSPAKKIKCSFLDYVLLLMIG